MELGDVKAKITIACNQLGDDATIEDLFESLEENRVFEILKSDEGYWEDGGKYSYLNEAYFIAKENKTGKSFVINYSQDRSGSYYSDYYYGPLQINSIQNIYHWLAPKVIHKFDDEIELLSDYTFRYRDEVHTLKDLIEVIKNS